MRSTSGLPPESTKVDLSVKERVYRELRDQIVKLKLAPGTPLTEQQVASWFRVSRSSVREALSLLNHEGLVEIIPKKGAFVANLDIAIIREIYQLREVLEGLAARLAAPRIDTEELSRIERTLDTSEDASEIERAGRRLHELIIETAGNARLAGILRVLGSQILRIGLLVTKVSGRTEKSLQEHKRIIQALKKRDSGLAERAMKRHLLSTMHSTYRVVIKGS